MTEDYVIKILRWQMSYTTQRAWAREHGVSKSLVGDVLTGRRGLGPKILEAMGIEKMEEVTYRWKDG